MGWGLKGSRPARISNPRVSPSSYGGSLGHLAKAVSLPGIAGNYVSTPDSAAFDVVSDIDIRVKFSGSWTPIAAGILISKWNDITENSFALFINISGQLSLYWSANGTAALNTDSTASVPFVTGAMGWVRATLDVDNGAAGSTTNYYTSTDGIIWTPLGTPRINVVTSIFNSASVVRISGLVSESFPLIGNVHYAEVRNGIDGPVVGSFNPNRALVNANTITSPTGEVWTINRSGAQPAFLF